MKTEDRYLKFVQWSDDDHCYVGYCPDLFPWGGVCHGAAEEETYAQLCALVRGEIEELRAAGKEIPVPATRAMREAVMA
jgi:predicted RNase H-like HicB family nuclease